MTCNIFSLFYILFNLELCLRNYVFYFWGRIDHARRVTEFHSLSLLGEEEKIGVELLKPTTPKNCIFMPFLDTNSHLTSKPYNCDIKCPGNSESYEQHGFWGPSLVGVFFNKREYSGADWMVLLICTKQTTFIFHI